MYDEPISIRYELGTDTPFSVAANSNKQYVGPKGKKGIVRDIEVAVVTNLVGTTTVPEIVVGSAAGGSQYGRFRLGSTAILGWTTVTAAAPLRASRTITSSNEVGAASLPGKQWNDFPEHASVEKAYIPADTPFFISGVAGVGGSPAGTAVVGVEIDWF